MAIDDVLFITLDSCRFDTFASALAAGSIPNISSVAPLHKAKSPSYFTYGSHSSFWMGFTPGVVGSNEPLLNPKAGKVFRMSFSGHSSHHEDCFQLRGANIIDGFRESGYMTLGTGSVDWFDPSTDTGAVLGAPFDHFYFAGNTWSLADQLAWIESKFNRYPIINLVSFFSMSVKRMFLIGIKELLGNVGPVPVFHLVIITPVPNNADFANVQAWNGLTISLHLY